MAENKEDDKKYIYKYIYIYIDKKRLSCHADDMNLFVEKSTSNFHVQLLLLLMLKKSILLKRFLKLTCMSIQLCQNAAAKREEPHQSVTTVKLR